MREVFRFEFGRDDREQQMVGDMDDREQLRQYFNRVFEHWEIKLPDEAMPPGVVWITVQRGWQRRFRESLGNCY